jgi:hypothetical protein
MMHLPWKCKSCRPLGMRTWKVRHSQSSVTSSSCGYLSLLGRWLGKLCSIFHPSQQGRAGQSRATTKLHSKVAQCNNINCNKDSKHSESHAAA